MWQNGPMPPDTWNWGGVVVTGEDAGDGFWFADFQGDHVRLFPGGRVVQAADVARYNNCLELPPRCVHGTRKGG